MAKINLEKLSLAELKTLNKDVEKAIAKAEKASRADALQAISDTAAKHGFALADLVGGKKKAGKSQPVAKYAHPENASTTWSGRGRQPAWIKEALAAGKSLDDFLIK